MKLILEKFEPTENRLLVEVAKKEEITSGGIIIPDTAKEKPSYGYVVKSGPGLINPEKTDYNGYNVRLPMGVSVGDAVLFDEYSIINLKIEDKDYVLIKETDVLAII